MIVEAGVSFVKISPRSIASQIVLWVKPSDHVLKTLSLIGGIAWKCLVRIKTIRFPTRITHMNSRMDVS